MQPPEKVRLQPVLIWLYLAAALCFCSSLATSWIHSNHNSDTIVPAFISIDAWTPYYWGENRLGMLVALLASPVQDYGWNVILQTFANGAAGIGCIFLFLRLAFPDRRAETVLMATTLSVAAILLLYRPAVVQPLLLSTTPYLPAEFLVLCALATLTGRGPSAVRLFLFAVLLVLALWINLSSIVFAGLAVALWPATPRYKHLLRGSAIATAAVGFLLCRWFAQQYPGMDYQKFEPLSVWPNSMFQLLNNMRLYGLHMEACVVLFVAGGAAALVRWRRRPEWSGSAAFLVAASVQFLAVVGSYWVTINNYEYRYITLPFFTLIVLSLGSLLLPLSSGLLNSLGSPMTVATASMLLVSFGIQAFGLPDPGAAIGRMEQVTRPYAAAFDGAACTHLVGNYWTVWMAEFHDRLTNRQPVRWGITYRSEPSRPLWDASVPSNRTYCAACSDQYIEMSRTDMKIPRFRLAGRRGDICLFRSEDPSQ